MLLEKILLGITLAAPIGPVSLEMIKRGLDKGFWGAFVVRLGGSLGNSLCLVASYFGLAFLLNTDMKMAICGFLGSMVLLYMGVKSLLDKRKHQFQTDPASPNNILNGLGIGFVLSIANPIGILFWIGIFAATLDRTNHSYSLMGLAQNFSIIIGVLIWGAFLSGLLEIGKRFFNNKLIQFITTAAGIMLIYFGLKYAYKAYLLI